MGRVLAVLVTAMSCVACGQALDPRSSSQQPPAARSDQGMTAVASTQEPLYRMIFRRSCRTGLVPTLKAQSCFLQTTLSRLRCASAPHVTLQPTI